MLGVGPRIGRIGSNRATGSEDRRGITKVARVLDDVRRLHPVQHHKDQDVQRKAVSGKEIPARPIGKDHARDREDDPLRQAHPLIRTRRLSPSKGRKR